MNDEPLPGIITLFSDLDEWTLISLQGLATQLGVSLTSIKRYIATQELPEPVPLGRERYWTVQALREAFAHRLTEAAKAHGHDARKIVRLRQGEPHEWRP